MAKDTKKAKEPKVSPKDKDIHLNVVGVPPNNVDVKKTYPRQNNEDYQLYRISIDTKGKRERERKRRLSSLEPSSPKKTKTKQRPKSQANDVVSSEDSFTDISRPHKPRTPGGHKDKASTPKSRRRESVDSEICFTIPGEKGKAIRIVGSSTKANDDNSSQDSSVPRSKRKRAESPRQVGFARLDEVYGTDPEETSIESRDSSPYKRTSPQVYKMENTSPNQAFKDPNGKRGNDGNVENALSTRTSSPSENSSKGGTSQQPRNKVPRGAHATDYDRPSTSKGDVEKEPESSTNKQSGPSRAHPANKSVEETSSKFPETSQLSSEYELTSAYSTSGSKGKYPFYPYDKQKRSKSPSRQPQEAREDKEPYLYPKLPSIPEVRSTTEQEPSGPQEVGRPARESSVPTEPITRSKDANASPVPLLSKDNKISTAQPYSKPLKAPDEPVLSNKHHFFTNPLKQKNPTDPHASSKNPSESVSPYPNKVQKIDPNKLSHSTPTDDQRGSIGNKPAVNDLPRSSQMQKPFPNNIQRNTLGENPILYGAPKLNQMQIPTQKISQSNSPMSSRIPTNKDNPVVNYNVQNSPSRLGTPDTNTRELSNKPQGLSPSIKETNSPPLESSVYKIRNAEPTREPVVQNARTTVNKTPMVIKRPVTSDIGVNTERPLKAKEKIMLEINEELSKTSSPFSQKSHQGSVQLNVPSVEKDTKRTKSKLGAFVSSIPKPSFKRNKSQEKKPTDNNVISHKPQPNVDENANTTRRQVNAKDEARRPVAESAIVKQTHEPVVEAYPDWVNSHPEDRWSDGQPQSAKESPLSGRNAPKDYNDRTPSPGQPHSEDRRYDGQPQSVKESPLSGRNAPKDYNDRTPSPGQPHSEDRRNDGQPQSGKENPLSGRNEPKSYSKDFAPYGIDDSPSIELANRSYGERPISKNTSSPISEEMNRSNVPDQEEEPFDHVQGPHKMTKGVDSDTWSPENTPKRQRLQDGHSSGSIPDNLEHLKESDYDYYGKHKTPYVSPAVVAYPGHINEQTPFNYESQFVADPEAETQALASLENDFDAYEKTKKDTQDPKTQSVDGNPSLVSSAPRTAEEASKDKSYGHPVQVMKGSSVLQFAPENRTPRELRYDHNKKKPLQSLVYKTGEKAENKSPVSKGNMSGSNHVPTTLDGSEEQIKPFDGSPYGNPPEVQVYQGHIPDTTNSVFNPGDSTSERSPKQRKNKKTPSERQGPKGILIFVNKKNDTASPFENSRASPKAEDYLLRPKNKREAMKSYKKVSSSSGGTSASSVAPGGSHGEGDKKEIVERTPSGRKITQRFPCGCIRIITSARGNELKQEELISAFCKEGSQCEVSRAQRSMLGRSIDSSLSWNPESTGGSGRGAGGSGRGAGGSGRGAGGSGRGAGAATGGFPDIEVIADGVVSKKPIKPRPPAPTMNGAKLTGSFKINSNKANAVCNIYLDRKLKKYLRNNMDKIKLLLEDDS